MQVVGNVFRIIIGVHSFHLIEIYAEMLQIANHKNKRDARKPHIKLQSTRPDMYSPFQTER